MIQSKKDYDFYLLADKIALSRTDHLSIKMRMYFKFISPDEVWDFEKLLRKTEYVKNCKQEKIYILQYAMCLRRLHHYQTLLGFYINPNNFGPGLSISHPGPIIVNPSARIGSNCRIHPGVTIGTAAGCKDKTPHMGNNIFIGPGATIIGLIEIADDIAIGANSVVNRSFTEPGITIAGNPAKKVSDKGSFGYLKRATELVEQQQ
jgi:serine O-acetyltransferase